MGAIAAVVADAAIDTAAIVADGRFAQVSVCQTHGMIAIVTQNVAAADRQLISHILPRTSVVDSRS